MHKLSIITINKNNAKGLQKTIESVINQTYPNIEFIVIDGASTDGSTNIIDQYSKYLSFWSSEPDKGIYHAMNKGIKQSNGQYLQFLNSGDILAANNVAECMLHTMPDDCMVLYGNRLLYYANGKIIRDNFNGLKNSQTPNLSGKLKPINKSDKNYTDNPVISGITLLDMYNGTISHSSAYIHNSLFKKYGFYDENLKIVSDWKFYLQCVFGNEKMYYRNIDTTIFDMQGISSSLQDLAKEERKKVLENILPAAVLKTLSVYNLNIQQTTRLNRNAVIKTLLWLLERCMFKIEKIKYKKFF